MARSYRAKSRAPRIPGVMNKTEKRFQDNVLIPLRMLGEIVEFRFEAIKFRFGNDWKATYLPDFMVVLPNFEIEFHDVKGSGGWEEDALQKIKACAAMYPQFHWIGSQERRGERGIFDREVF